MKRLINQILKFGVVGGIAFVIDYGVLYICTEWFEIYYLTSSVISFSISVIFNYVASVVWVFEVKEDSNEIKKLLLFIVFSIIGLIINQIIMWFGVEQMSFYYMAVKILATVIVMIYNFITRKIFLE